MKQSKRRFKNNQEVLKEAYQLNSYQELMSDRTLYYEILSMKKNKEMKEFYLKKQKAMLDVGVKQTKKRRSKWTIEELLEKAAEYNCVKEYIADTSNSGVFSAKKYGVYDICIHIIKSKSIPATPKREKRVQKEKVNKTSIKKTMVVKVNWFSKLLKFLKII